MKFTIIKSCLARFSGIFALGTPSNIHGTAVSYRCAKFGAFVNSVTILTLRDLTIRRGEEEKTIHRPQNSTLIWYHIRDLKLSHTVGLASPQECATLAHPCNKGEQGWSMYDKTIIVILTYTSTFIISSNSLLITYLYCFRENGGQKQ